MASSSPNCWIFSYDDLKYTPSRADGISYEQECYERAKGVDLIVRVGSVRVNVPILTVATASLFLHRFYMVRSLKQYPARETAMACLFLAGKVEESLRKVEAVVNYCLRLEDRRAGREPDVHPSSEPFKKLVAQVLYLEEVILVALQFDLTVSHPHPLVSRAVKRYTESGATSTWQGNALGRCAWQILSDMYTTPLCTLHPQEVLAAASLLLAYHTIIDLPPFSQQQYRDALQGLSTEEGRPISFNDKNMLEEIDSAVSFMISWWAKAKNSVFQENSKRLSTIVPKTIDFSEPLTSMTAETPGLPSDASQTEQHQKAIQENAFNKQDDTMQLDSPVVPPVPSPDKEYEGPPTPG